MKNKKLSIVFLFLLVIFSCGKNYHDKGYSESDELDIVLTNTMMDSTFRTSCLVYLKETGIITNDDDLKLSIVKNVETLDLKDYKITVDIATVNGFRGIEFFSSLKVLDVTKIQINQDFTNSIRLIRELYRVRNILNLDTTKIYFDPNIEILAKHKVIYGKL